MYAHVTRARFVRVGLLAVLLVRTAVAETPEPTTASPETASYDVGLVLGGQLRQSGTSEAIQWDALVRGLKEGLAGAAASNEQRAQANQFLKSSREALADRNRAEARAFLAKNGTAAGVHTTPSGLQYRVLSAGNPAGPSPRPKDQVTVQYRAALANGVEFDSSRAHDHPATFRVDSVIKGWQEAIQMMKPGAKWELFVPPDLGYGAGGPPPVPPGSLLVYELELLRIEPPTEHISPRDEGAAHAAKSPSAETQAVGERKR